MLEGLDFDKKPQEQQEKQKENDFQFNPSNFQFDAANFQFNPEHLDFPFSNESSEENKQKSQISAESLSQPQNKIKIIDQIKPEQKIKKKSPSEETQKQEDLQILSKSQIIKRHSYQSNNTDKEDEKQSSIKSSSHNTQNLIKKYDTTNSKSQNSNLVSSNLSANQVQVNDLQNLIEMLQRRQGGRVAKIVYDDGSTLDVKYVQKEAGEVQEKQEEADQIPVNQVQQPVILPESIEELFGPVAQQNNVEEVKIDQVVIDFDPAKFDPNPDILDNMFDPKPAQPNLVNNIFGQQSDASILDNIFGPQQPKIDIEEVKIAAVVEHKKPPRSLKFLNLGQKENLNICNDQDKEDDVIKIPSQNPMSSNLTYSQTQSSETQEATRIQQLERFQITKDVCGIDVIQKSNSHFGFGGVTGGLLQRMREKQEDEEQFTMIFDATKETENSSNLNVSMSRGMSLHQSNKILQSNVSTKLRRLLDNYPPKELIYRLFNELEQKTHDFDQLFRFLKGKYAIEQDSELREKIKQFDKLMNSGLHLTFMFAMPLIIEYVNNNNQLEQEEFTYRKLHINQINYHEEAQNVYQTLRSTNKNIRYKKICGTIVNLQNILSEGTIALHFAGHGAKNDDKLFHHFDNSLKNEGDLLIFENEHDGTPCYLSEIKLKALLQENNSEIQLVFVASCHSEKTARLFHQAGAKHVICIRQDSQISDKAQIYFSGQFYHTLFVKDTTICKAFGIAKERVQMHPDKNISKEWFKFLIIRDIDDYDKITQGEFLQNQLKNSKKHECWQLGPFDNGKVHDIGNEEGPLFRMGMANVQDLVGRSEDINELIKYIYSYRLVTVLGEPGIGKTTISRGIGLYLEERNRFKDGIIYVSLRNSRQANMLITQLFEVILSKIRIDELEDLNQFNKYKKMREEFLKEQLGENTLTIDLNQLEKIIKCLKEREILIILDNIEDPLYSDEKNLKLILQKILDECTSIKFLSTSRIPLDQIGNTQEIGYKLENLSSEWAVRLFLQKAKLALDVPKDREQVKAFLDQTEKRDDSKRGHATTLQIRLMNHQMIKKLNGHPMTISLIASMKKDHSLIEMYSLLNSQTFATSIQNQSHPLFYLQVSIEASISFLLEKNPEAVRLFCLIGMMPGGLLKDDISKLWPKNDWYGHLTKLIDSSLVQKKVEINIISDKEQVSYCLLPFMNYPAEKLNKENFDFSKMHKQTIQYFCNLMQTIYQKIDIEKEREEQQDIRAKLVLYETNVWACLERIKEMKQQNKNANDSQWMPYEQYKMLRQQSSMDDSMQVRQSVDTNKSKEQKSIITENILILKEQKSSQLQVSEQPDLQKKRSNSLGSRNGCLQLQVPQRQKTQLDRSSNKSNQKSIGLLSSKESNKLSSGKNSHKSKKMNPNEFFHLQGMDSDSSFQYERVNTLHQTQKKKSLREQKILPKKQLLDDISDSEESTSFQFGELGFKKNKKQSPPKYEQFKGYQEFEVEDVDNPELIKKRSNSVLMQQLQLPKNPEPQRKSFIRRPTQISPSVSKIKQPTRLPNPKKVTVEERRKQTQENIKQKKDEKQQAKQIPKGPWESVLTSQFQSKISNEGQLIIYYASILILNQQYDQAIRVLTLFGSIKFEGKSGLLIKMNIKKLQAIATFKTNCKFNKVEELLENAKNKFKDLRCFHGVATCALAKSHFMFRCATEFVNCFRNEEQVLKTSLQACLLANEYYQKISHLQGQAYCLELENHIVNKIITPNHPQIEQIKQMREQNFKTQRRLRNEDATKLKMNKSGYRHRSQAGKEMSLFIEYSFITANSQNNIVANVNTYPFLFNPQKQPPLKVSRDEKGRASSVEIDVRSTNSFEKPTTTSFEEQDSKFIIKQRSRRGRSIESNQKMPILKKQQPENNIRTSNKIDKKRFHSPMNLAFKNEAQQHDVLSESFSNNQSQSLYSEVESISQLSSGQPMFLNRLIPAVQERTRASIQQKQTLQELSQEPNSIVSKQKSNNQTDKFEEKFDEEIKMINFEIEEQQRKMVKITSNNETQIEFEFTDISQESNSAMKKKQSIDDSKFNNHKIFEQVLKIKQDYQDDSQPSNFEDHITSIIKKTEEFEKQNISESIKYSFDNSSSDRWSNIPEDEEQNFKDNFISTVEKAGNISGEECEEEEEDEVLAGITDVKEKIEMKKAMQLSKKQFQLEYGDTKSNKESTGDDSSKRYEVKRPNKETLIIQKKRKRFENPLNLKPPIEDLSLIQIDKSKLNPEQKDMLNVLYDMYKEEPILAQRNQIQKQISDYLMANNIEYSVAKPKTQNSVPMVKGVPFDPSEVEGKKMAKSQKMRPKKQVDMQRLTNQIRQKDDFLQQIPDKVAELSDESNVSDIELADNTNFLKKSLKKGVRASQVSERSSKLKGSRASINDLEDPSPTLKTSVLKTLQKKDKKSLFEKQKFKQEAFKKKGSQPFVNEEAKIAPRKILASDTSDKDLKVPSSARTPKDMMKIFTKVPKIFGYQPKKSVDLGPPKTDRTEKKLELLDNLTLSINGKIKLIAKLQDITEVDTDIIVSPSNIYLESTSGIAGQLIMKGGLQIQKDSRVWITKYGPVKTGTCAYTTAGTLSSKFIIHTPGPNWTSYPEKKSIELLKSCIVKSLDLSINSAKLGEIKSISFPMISSGNFGGPENLVASIILESIIEWSQRQNTGKINMIQLCTIFENQIDFIKTELLRFSQELQPQEESKSSSSRLDTSKLS